MGNKITLIVIRHGKSAHNLGSEKSHTFAGSNIDNGISAEAIETTHLLSKKILKLNIPSFIFCSNLKRSKETAKIIANDIADIKKIDLKTIEIPELGEINIGDFAGHTEDEVKLLFPAAANAFYHGEIEQWDFPGGENYHQVCQRLKIAMRKIQDCMKSGQTALIVGHGMVNRILFYNFQPNNKKLWQSRTYEHDKIVILEDKKESDL